MNIKDILIRHLLKYRKDSNMNQSQMAAYLGIGERTYQTIEVSGEIKKVSDLLDIIEKTGFNITQNIANSPPNDKSMDYLNGKLNGKIEELEKQINTLREDNIQLIRENTLLKNDRPSKNLKKVSAG